jgi:hypothetical protein
VTPRCGTWHNDFCAYEAILKRLYWRTYAHHWTEWMWLPSIEFRMFPVRHYAREISFDWLKWGFAVRWWRQ